MGEGFAVLRVGSFENRLQYVIRCLWSFVPPFQDSWRLAKMSFPFCGGMNGICCDLLGIA